MLITRCLVRGLLLVRRISQGLIVGVRPAARRDVGFVARHFGLLTLRRGFVAVEDRIHAAFVKWIQRSAPRKTTHDAYKKSQYNNREYALYKEGSPLIFISA